MLLCGDGLFNRHCTNLSPCPRQSSRLAGGVHSRWPLNQHKWITGMAAIDLHKTTHTPTTAGALPNGSYQRATRVSDLNNATSMILISDAL